MPRVFGTGGLGIVIFFSIGRYLVAGAWLRRPQFGSYIANRAIRIFPALALVVLVTVFLMGPLVTTLSVTDYFTHPKTWEYLQNLVLRPRYSLPGVFTENPYAHSVNGSLWTLLPTFFAYLLIPLLLLRGRTWSITALVVFGGASAALAVLLPTLDEKVVIYGSLIASDAKMWVYFAGGALLQIVLRREHLRIDVAFGLLVVHVLLIHVAPGVTQYSLWLVMPYILVSFGLQSTPLLRRVDRFGDLSYGIFLSAFPIQQLLVLYGPAAGLPTGMVWNVAVVTVLSALVAVVSLRLVENPAVRVRRWLSADARRARASHAPESEDAPQGRTAEGSPGSDETRDSSPSCAATEHSR